MPIYRNISDTTIIIPNVGELKPNEVKAFKAELNHDSLELVDQEQTESQNKQKNNRSRVRVGRPDVVGEELKHQDTIK